MILLFSAECVSDMFLTWTELLIFWKREEGRRSEALDTKRRGYRVAVIAWRCSVPPATAAVP